MDDGLIQKILGRSLGDRFSSFATAEPPDSIGPLDAFESILYSLEKRDLIRVLEVIQAFSIILSMGGIPLIYLGDEIAMLNDYGYANNPATSEDGRWVHRPYFDWERAAQRDDPHGLGGGAGGAHHAPGRGAGTAG